MCTSTHVQKEMHITETFTIYSRHLTLGEVYPRMCLATLPQGPKMGTTHSGVSYHGNCH